MSGTLPELLCHPVTALGLQCAASTIAIGLRQNTSFSSRLIQILATPVHVGCAAIVVLKGRDHVRSSWAAWIAGFSLSTALRCLGPCFYKEEDNSKDQRLKRTEEDSGKHDKSTTKSSSAVKWFLSNFSKLMDFRHLNRPDEAKNSPRFSAKDPNYVPTRARFLLNTAAEMVLSSLLIDVLTGSPLPGTALVDFAPARMHLFTRLRSVTGPELGLRFMLPVTVFAVGAALLKLGHDVFAFAAVGSGMSPPEDWRPQFGSITEAFTLRKWWGEVWHQNLRITFTTWSDWIAHKVFRLPRSSESHVARLTTRYSKLVLAFGISGLLHLLVEVASGVPITKARPTVFFLYQALGIIIEDAAQACYKNGRKGKVVPIWTRLVGYVWVWSFMAWSVPWWIYPPTHYYALQGQAPRSLVPFSVIRWSWT